MFGHLVYSRYKAPVFQNGKKEEGDGDRGQSHSHGRIGSRKTILKGDRKNVRSEHMFQHLNQYALGFFAGYRLSDTDILFG